MQSPGAPLSPVSASLQLSIPLCMSNARHRSWVQRRPELTSKLQKVLAHREA